ncbi:uncharacterized protein VDAG_07582 [Verticillium dahliae VdLs.17]|uniref:Uncharacterized protein n=1 Tax=Verticillium dahliae (strain VdLs.17 / ATCC MYA-4575 / FGSC 10137) TaxID=498257 RepID=G2XC04_VERDV|nr:uncharacterized protein VDAG_07582 [Verticillium dahliae VdLs.17]EGY16418.1 hypothetical protein VDAG_07582 [Verticillium dahliae VdLs.17]KAH6699288.1 hypothetical protein EV126DRAFT_423467 [Verticillium dahliae]
MANNLAVKQDMHDWKRPLGNRDGWNSPDFRFEVTLDRIDHGSDGEEEYSETTDIFDKQRLEVLDALLAHPDIDVTARDTLNAVLPHYIRHRNGVLTRPREAARKEY